MGRTEQTFFRRGNASGQQAHEKMFNIARHQGNVNQNHYEMLPDTCQNGYHQKDHKQQMLGEDVEKREPS